MLSIKNFLEDLEYIAHAIYPMLMFFREEQGYVRSTKKTERFSLSFTHETLRAYRLNT